MLKEHEDMVNDMSGARETKNVPVHVYMCMMLKALPQSYK